MMGWRAPAFLRNCGGSAATEFALVMPMLLALLFVMFEGGHYLFVQHQVVKGVRDGARFASRQPFSAYSCSTIDAAAETDIKEVTRTGKISGGTARVMGWTNAEVTVSVSCPATAVTTGIYASMTNAPRVVVAARVPYVSLFRALGGSIGNGAVVTAYQQAAVMGI